MPFNDPAIRDAGLLGYRQRFRLVEDLEFTAPIGFTELRIVVPAGFVTDFASTPRCLWSFFPPWGKYLKSAILHDYLYSHDGNCSRFFADALFRDTMIQEGVPAWQATAMYYAVRLFAAFAWRKA